MQTLELECPACGELLELDAGFAGGVCRCSACGTLMTVPHDATGGERAEQLSRPDRPDDPSGLTGSMGSMGVQDVPRERPSSRASGRRPAGKRGKGKKRAKAKAGRRDAGGRTGERIEQGEYTTASGRKVKIDRATRVPTAKTRRTGVRIATFVVFFGLVLVVVAIGTVAVVYMLQNPKGGPATGGSDDEVVELDPTQFTYTASANPFTLDQPNVFGLPISGTVAIVIENKPANERWLVPVAEMIGTGLGQPGSKARVMVFTAGNGDVLSFSDNPVDPVMVTPRELKSLLTDVQNETSPSTVDLGLRAAIDDDATMVILITGQPTAAEVAAWEERLADHPDLVVHAVLIDGFSDEMREWVRARSDGRFINRTTSQILDWQEDADGDG